MPNQPKTPNTVVRLAPELREPLEREAQERGIYLSDVIREACAEHIERPNLRALWLRWETSTNPILLSAAGDLRGIARFTMTDAERERWAAR